MNSFRAKRYWAEFAGQLPIFAIFIVIFALSTALLWRYGMPFPASDIYMNLGLYPKGFGLFMICDGVVQLWRHRPDRPIPFLWRRYSDPEMIGLFLARLPMLLVLLAFLPLFALLKPLIPLLNPYEWDMALIHLDRVVFFGNDPWRLLQPVLGYPLVTAGLAFLYHAWFGLVYPGGLVFLYAKQAEHVRRQYLATFMLVWIIGGIFMAALLSSLGPCFLEPILGNPYFAEQMAYLQAANEQIPVMVIHMQELLLENYRVNGVGHGLGISAMPSMHVAMAFLFFLAIRQLSRRAGQVFFTFFMLIWIASVHLAYHYALDGLVSVILTYALWRMSGALFAWWDNTVMPALEKHSPNARPPLSADC